MNNDSIRRLTPVIVAALTVLALGPAGSVRAQPELFIPLHASEVQLDRLAPGTTSGEAVFVLNDADLIRVEISTSVDNLVTSIEGPAGQLIDETTISGLGGTYTQISIGPGGGGLLVGILPGERYVYEFPSLGSGNYTVRFDAGAGLSEEIPVVTQVSWTAPVSSALFATEPILALGNPSVLSAAVFQGPTPVAGATVEVTILTPGGALLNLSLLDDGGDADAVAGDGLYSGEFVPGEPGLFEVVAQITGTASSGLAFSHQATVQVEVVTPAGSLIGGVTDQGVDDNGNGLFDRLVLSVEVDAAEAGEHVVFVTLETAGGQMLTRSAAATLAAGIQTIDVGFDADALQNLREDGPYQIPLIELGFIGAGGLQPSDRLLDAGMTQAYDLSAFERAPILLTGTSSDVAQDLNGNGLFDRLNMTVGVDLISGGFYQWSGRLIDETGTEIDIFAGDGNLSAGVTTIAFTFDGTLIGQNATDGPYILTDLLLFGAGGSLLASDVAQTQAYQFVQFEGAPERCPSTLKITAFDSDQPGDPDTQEFVGITNQSASVVSVSGCVLVLYDGLSELAYYARNLSGPVAPGATYLVGNFDVDGADLIIPNNTIQNGPDAIALYKDDAANFPVGAPLSFQNLISAIVYINDENVYGAAKNGGSDPASVLRGLREVGSIAEGGQETPLRFELEQNFPNPFNPVTTIRFSLPERGPVRLTVYDVTGRVVQRLVDQALSAGVYEVQWNGRDLNGRMAASGVYFYQVQAGGFVETRVMTLMK